MVNTNIRLARAYKGSRGVIVSLENLGGEP